MNSFNFVFHQRKAKEKTLEAIRFSYSFFSGWKFTKRLKSVYRNE